MSFYDVCCIKNIKVSHWQSSIRLKNDVFNFKAVNGDGNEKICHFQHFLSWNWKERIHNIKLEQTMLGVPRIFPFLKHLIDMSLPGRHYGARFFIYQVNLVTLQLLKEFDLNIGFQNNNLTKQWSTTHSSFLREIETNLKHYFIDQMLCWGLWNGLSFHTFSFYRWSNWSVFYCHEINRHMRWNVKMLASTVNKTWKVSNSPHNYRLDFDKKDTR